MIKINCYHFLLLLVLYSQIQLRGSELYSILTPAPPPDDLDVGSVLLMIPYKPESTQLDCAGRHDAKDVV